MRDRIMRMECIRFCKRVTNSAVGVSAETWCSSGSDDSLRQTVLWDCEYQVKSHRAISAPQGHFRASHFTLLLFQYSLLHSRDLPQPSLSLFPSINFHQSSVCFISPSSASDHDKMRFIAGIGKAIAFYCGALMGIKPTFCQATAPVDHLINV